jgi:SAM-dependent methyltransferase
VDARTRWNERYRAGQGPTRVNPRLQKYLSYLKRGRALDLAAGVGQNAQLLTEWRVILADLSEEALARASGARVQCEAGALPFPPATFDTVICTRFFDPRVDFAQLLTPGGTLFFEAFTVADDKYRPEFDPAHRFNPADIATLFQGLEILHWEETDDGTRVFGTLVARKRDAHS